MRSLFGSIVLLLVMLVIGCTWVDPNDCWPNTSGGLGGGGPIPIGAGVGATSGDFLSPPPKHPLSPPPGETPNPCVEADPTTGDPISLFKPSDFPFVTIVADDGKDVGGGWQEAKAGMIIGPTATGGAACVVRIGMPLRTAAWGRVPPSIAAIYSAKVANAVVIQMDKEGYYDLPPGIICSRLKPRMQKQFDDQYKGMGAQMMVPVP